MSASVSKPRRRAPQMSHEQRAKTLAHFQARIAEREAADPMHPLKVLFRIADPVSMQMGSLKRLLKDPSFGLSDHHETLRRCFVLRAWCARRLGWHDETANALRFAAENARLARGARKEGR